MVFWVFLLIVPPAKGGDRGWFGSPECQYQCHTVNGDCSGGCTKGWFGPDCQYADLMYTNATASTPQVLRDGNHNTCITDQNLQSVTLSLTHAFPFTWMSLRIQNPDLSTLLGLIVELKGVNGESVSCNNMRKIPFNKRILDVYCDGDVAVQSVTITGDGVLSLCTVFYSGGRNIALKQNATQSSIFVNPKGEPFGAALAVDGDNDQNFNHNSCTATSATDTARIWRVVFSQPRMVNTYVLYNRRDCCGYRLKGFTLTSYSADDRTVFTHQDTETDPQDQYTVTSAGITTPVSYVVIKGGNVDLLTICEAEIYGDSVCKDGMYGQECSDTCSSSCVTTENTCEVSTGVCSQCQPGMTGFNCGLACPTTYHGSHCQERCSTNCKDDICNGETGDCINCPAGKQGNLCGKDCPPTQYGENCLQSCSINCLDSLCDSVTGRCDKCISGKTGAMCDQDCPAKSYGEGCSLTCSTNCKDQLCNTVNGKCDICPLGKMGDFCDEDCVEGKYGQNCSLPCNKNCKNMRCDAVDGTCTRGCNDGYKGLMCEENCDFGTYGAGCNNNCSTSCIHNSTAEAGSPCDHVNGNCIYGCQTGYTGKTCDTMARSGSPGGDDDSVPLGAIIGAAIGALVVVALIVGAILLWRRRRGKKDSTSNKNDNRAENGNRSLKDDVASSSRSDTSQQGNPYEVVSSASTGKGLKKEKSSNDGAYYNVSLDSKSTAIPVSHLQNFVKTQPKDFYEKQFKGISENESATTNIGQSNENRAKNRYKNICAYDHSRVHLNINKDKGHGDYINASYLEGYKSREKFIACQAPTKLIMEDFVRMLWEQKVKVVVMLTNLVEQGKQKCEQYWPQDGEIRIGEIKIELTTTDVFADYTIRRLYLSKGVEEGNLLTQFHFTSWPDKDVPTTPWGLVDFEQRVDSTATDRPIVVHCSAGVGRTGTFIALRNVMKEAEDTGYVDFFTTVQKLRHDRINMVQTASQYEFLHQAAQVAIVCMGTTVTSSDIQKRIAKLDTTSSSGETFMQREFQAICAVCCDEDDAIGAGPSNTKGTYVNTTGDNKLKDRLRNVPAKEYYRPHLSCENDSMGNYINAVFVPSFQKENGQLLSQLPLPTTVTDFWRLVTQYKVSLVVAFELDLKEKDSSIGDYLPKNKEEALEVPLFKVSVSSLTAGDVFEEQKVIVSSDEKTERRKVPVLLEGEHRLVHLKARKVDLTPDNLLAIIKQIRSHNRGDNGRTVYLCRNGATYSGLVCVLTLLLDRMDHDLRLTVPLVVGVIKSIRPQVIPTLEQYKLLYQVLHLYNETNNVYGNLGQSTGGDAGTSAFNNEPDETDKDTDRQVYANM